MMLKSGNAKKASRAGAIDSYEMVLHSEKCFVKNAVQSDVINNKGGIGNFTITDSDGNTWNLYEQLDLGKTVFLDLFTTG